jgi:CheY-specific phosphatase CheX
MEEVLEKMFFIQCLREPLEYAPESEVVAHLKFEGEPSGALTLRVTAGAARSVAADFLGVEEQELSESHVGDVVCELANMICGSVLSRVESAATFRLSSPQILAESDWEDREAGTREPMMAPPPVEDNSTVYAMDIGSGRMVVSIVQETPTWPTAERYAY